MTLSRRLLIVGGLALAIWGMGYGIWYAVFIEHQTLDGLGSALATGFMRAAENRMAESQAALADAASRSFCVRAASGCARTLDWFRSPAVDPGNRVRPGRIWRANADVSCGRASGRIRNFSCGRAA